MSKLVMHRYRCIPSGYCIGGFLDFSKLGEIGGKKDFQPENPFKIGVDLGLKHFQQKIIGLLLILTLL